VGKLPEVGGAIGKGIREFRRASAANAGRVPADGRAAARGAANPARDDLCGDCGAARPAVSRPEPAVRERSEVSARHAGAVRHAHRSGSVPARPGRGGGSRDREAVETPLGTLQAALSLGDLIAREINGRVARTGEAPQFDVVSLSAAGHLVALGLRARE
jgi:hypothetical protein